MAVQEDFPPLRERALTLLVNLTVFYAAFFAATGRLLPTGNLESVWLISAYAMWILNLLSAPWFLPPRDALANAITAAIVLVTLDLSMVGQFRAELGAIRWITLLYCVGVAGLALSALFLHDRDQRTVTGRFLFQITEILGQGEMLYTAPAIISIVGAFQQSFSTIAWLVVLWVLFTIGRPVERIASAWRQWKADTALNAKSPSVGVIDRVDYPNIIRIRLNPGGTWKPRTLHVAAMPDGDQQFVLSLFAQVQGTEVIGTGLCVAAVGEKLSLPTGHVCVLPTRRGRRTSSKRSAAQRTRS